MEPNPHNVASAAAALVYPFRIPSRTSSKKGTKGRRSRGQSDAGEVDSSGQQRQRPSRRGEKDATQQERPTSRNIFFPKALMTPGARSHREKDNGDAASREAVSPSTPKAGTLVLADSKRWTLQDPGGDAGEIEIEPEQRNGPSPHWERSPTDRKPEVPSKAGEVASEKEAIGGGAGRPLSSASTIHATKPGSLVDRSARASTITESSATNVSESVRSSTYCWSYRSASTVPSDVSSVLMAHAPQNFANSSSKRKPGNYSPHSSISTISSMVPIHRNPSPRNDFDTVPEADDAERDAPIRDRMLSPRSSIRSSISTIVSAFPSVPVASAPSRGAGALEADHGQSGAPSPLSAVTHNVSQSDPKQSADIVIGPGEDNGMFQHMVAMGIIAQGRRFRRQPTRRLSHSLVSEPDVAVANNRPVTLDVFPSLQISPPRAGGVPASIGTLITRSHGDLSGGPSNLRDAKSLPQFSTPKVAHRDPRPSGIESVSIKEELEDHTSDDAKVVALLSRTSLDEAAPIDLTRTPPASMGRGLNGPAVAAPTIERNFASDYAQGNPASDPLSVRAGQSSPFHPTSAGGQSPAARTMSTGRGKSDSGSESEVRSIWSSRTTRMQSRTPASSVAEVSIVNDSLDSLDSLDEPVDTDSDDYMSDASCQIDDPLPLGYDINTLTPSLVYIFEYIKKKSTDRVIREVYDILHARGGQRTRANGDETTGQANGQYQGGGQGSGASGSQAQGSDWRPRQEQRPKRNLSDDEEDRGGDDPGKRLKLSGEPSPTLDPPLRRFACPFYQNCPERYAQQKACKSPNWKTVHRVKEHVYRNHYKLKCNRCQKGFKDKDKLVDHQRSTTQCPLNDPVVTADEVTEVQLDKMKKKQRYKGLTEVQQEEQRWREMYSIIFPEVPGEEIPSPYCNLEPPDLSPEVLFVLHRDLPHHVYSRLANNILPALELLPHDERQRLPEMIRRSVSDAIRDVFPNQPTQQISPLGGSPSRAANTPAFGDDFDLAVSVAAMGAGHDAPSRSRSAETLDQSANALDEDPLAAAMTETIPPPSSYRLVPRVEMDPSTAAGVLHANNNFFPEAPPWAYDPNAVPPGMPTATTGQAGYIDPKLTTKVENDFLGGHHPGRMSATDFLGFNLFNENDFGPVSGFNEGIGAPNNTNSYMGPGLQFQSPVDFNVPARPHFPSPAAEEEGAQGREVSG